MYFSRDLLLPTTPEETYVRSHRVEEEEEDEEEEVEKPQPTVREVRGVEGQPATQVIVDSSSSLEEVLTL